MTTAIRIAPAFLALLVAIHLPARGAGWTEVWDVEEGVRNACGGDYNHFEGGPSRATVQLVRGAGRAGSRAMRIRYAKQEAGYCGVWFHLYDEEAPATERELVDAAETPWLSFWVRGVKGGEDFTVQLADADWLAREDSAPAGRVSDYLGQALDTTWREVRVPVADARLRRTEVGGVTFNFTQPGEGTVYIDDIGFKSGPEVETPAAHPRALPPASVDSMELRRVLWVWETEPLLLDAAAADDFFAFCRARGVNELFLQLLYAFEDEETPAVRCRLLREAEMRRFLSRATGEGIRVHALDGHPTFALAPQHARVLAQVDAVLAFNADSAEDERFYGVHHDNEPYLMPAFESPRQEQILREYLDLNAAVMARIAGAGGGLVYGVDIPFWYDERTTGEEEGCRVTFRGRRLDVAQHVIELVDNVGVMDYRNFAGGADGMIRHGAGEVAYGDAAHTGIYLGAETYRDDPTAVYFPFLVAEADWPRFVEEAPGVTQSSTFEGYKLWHLAGDGCHAVGLARPEDAAADDFEQALEALARACRAVAPAVELTHAAGAVQRSLARHAGYTGYETFLLQDGEGRLRASGFRTTAQMPAKVTFAGRRRAYLEEVLAEVEDHFRGRPGFVGTAIHYYKTYRAMPE